MKKLENRKYRKYAKMKKVKRGNLKTKNKEKQERSSFCAIRRIKGLSSIVNKYLW